LGQVCREFGDPRVGKQFARAVEIDADIGVAFLFVRALQPYQLGKQAIA